MHTLEYSADVRALPEHCPRQYEIITVSLRRQFLYIRAYDANYVRYMRHFVVTNVAFQVMHADTYIITPWTHGFTALPEHCSRHYEIITAARIAVYSCIRCEEVCDIFVSYPRLRYMRLKCVISGLRDMSHCCM
jgi:hypothetical protein